MEKEATKAWELDTTEYSEPWYINSIEYAHTEKEARSKFLQRLSNETERLDKEEISYLNIRVRRYPSQDMKLWDGKFVDRFEYQRLEREASHNRALDGILADERITHCYIRKHGSYYCSNYCGYTQNLNVAGIYSKEDAVKHARNISEITLEPVKNVEVVAILRREIEVMQKRIDQLQGLEVESLQ